MVDELRVQRLLRAVADGLALLRAESVADSGQRAAPMWLPGVKYTFVRAIEACLDVAQHICAAEGWGPPADNASAMVTLARHGVVGQELAAELRLAVGFRNVLVHEYIAVDDSIVLAKLEDLRALESFVAVVANWLASRAGDVADQD